MLAKIDYSNPFIIAFFVGTILSFLVEHLLEFIDWKARLKTGGKLPDELEEIPAASVFDKEKLKNINDYKNQKYFFNIPSSICHFALTLALVVTGFYPWIFSAICKITGEPNGYLSTFLCAVLFVIFQSIPGKILSIPFSLFHEFRIEKKFGFSKMTLKLWFQDQLKGLLISLIFATGIIAAITGILIILPNHWWILITIFIFALTLIMQVLYPLIIAPMFNKFTPLEDGELKTKITELMKNIGFKASGIFVMDASKRSGHSNAYFGGLGKSKRIVLYDTLLKQLSTDELIAVLGHELGHFKLHHIIRKFFILIPIEFALMFALNFCAHSASLYTGFGFAVNTENILSMQFIGLFLASIVWGAFSDFVSPISNTASRRDEYQADNFSARLTKNPDALISGLIKLNSENLSELLPPKIYVFWNYSHPTLLERIKALKNAKID